MGSVPSGSPGESMIRDAVAAAIFMVAAVIYMYLIMKGMVTGQW